VRLKVELDSYPPAIYPQNQKSAIHVQEYSYRLQNNEMVKQVLAGGTTALTGVWRRRFELGVWGRWFEEREILA